MEVLTTSLLSTNANDTVGKYAIVALQFLLHSKTESEWQVKPTTCKQTESALKLLMQVLADTNRSSTQTQAIKSVCLLLQNQKIDKMPLFLAQIQDFISSSVAIEMAQHP